MKTSTRVLLVLLPLAAARLAPRVAAAQSPAALTPGEDVVVAWFDPHWAASVGVLPTIRRARLDVVRFDPDQLVGRRGRQIYFIETGSLRSVQRRVGTKPASAPEMVAGSGGGFIAAFVVGALAGSAGGGDAINTGLSSGVLVGAPLGAFAAWIASRSRGIYEDVDLPGRLWR